MATPLSPCSARDFVVARIPLARFSGPPATRENGNVCTETKSDGRAEGAHEDAHIEDNFCQANEIYMAHSTGV